MPRRDLELCEPFVVNDTFATGLAEVEEMGANVRLTW
jgi:hypothetical protein